MLYNTDRLLLSVLSQSTPEAIRFLGMLLYMLAPAVAMSLFTTVLRVRQTRRDTLSRLFLLSAGAAVGVLTMYAVRFGVSGYHRESLIVFNNIAVHAFYLGLLAFLVFFTRMIREITSSDGTPRPARERYFGAVQLLGLYAYAVGLLAFWISGVNIYIRVVEMAISLVLLSGFVILLTARFEAAAFQRRVATHACGTSLGFLIVSAAIMVMRGVDLVPGWADPVLVFPIYTIILSLVLLKHALTFVKQNQTQHIADTKSVAAAQAEFVRRSLSQYHITNQEARILRLVMQGRSNSEIAEVLGISEKTVRNHVSSLYQKTETGNRVELVQVFELAPH